jgi:hypothetical protein
MGGAEDEAQVEEEICWTMRLFYSTHFAQCHSGRIWRQSSWSTYRDSSRSGDRMPKYWITEQSSSGGLKFSSSGMFEKV